MGMNKTDFFNKLSGGAKWDVGVSIARGNPVPLDANSVFESLEAAKTYLAGVLAYPGQFIAVVADGNTDAYVIVTEASGTLALQKLATQTATGDVVKDVQALNTKLGELEADFLVANESIASHGTAIETLESSIEVLREDVDNVMLDMTKVFSYQGSVPTFSDLTTKADYTPAVGHVWNIVAAGGTIGDATIKAGDNVVYNGTGWDILAGTIDLSGYATTAAMNTAIGTAVDTAADDATAKAKAAQAAAEATASAALAVEAEKITANANAITALQTKDTELAADIAKKVSSEEFAAHNTAMNNALAAKADTSTVNSQLALKADTTAVNEALAGKVDNSTYATDKKTLEDAIATKASTSEVSSMNTNLLTEIAKKADASAVSTGLDAKADKVASAVSGNFAGLNASGNLVDSGKNADSFDVAGAAAAVLGKSTDTAGTATVHGALNQIENVSGTVAGHGSQIATMQETLGTKADQSVVNNLSTTVNEHTTTLATHGSKISGIEGTLADKASTSSVTALNTKYEQLETTVNKNQAAVQPAINAAIDNLNISQYQTKAAAKTEHDALTTAVESAASVAQNAKTAAATNADAIREINDESTGILAQAKTHANNIDTKLSDRISALEELTTGGEGSIAEQIATAVAVEKAARESADTTMQAEVDANEAAIAAMDTAYKAADAEMSQSLTDLQEALEAEVTRAKGEEKRVEDLVTAETTRATNAEEALQSAIDAVDAALKFAVNNDVEGMDSIKELATWVNTHGSDAANMTQAISNNTAAIAKEVKDRENAISSVNTAIETANGAIEALEGEVEDIDSRLQTAEGTLAAIPGNIASAVKAEADRAKAEEERIAGLVAAEVTARESAVEAIEAKIGTVPADNNLVDMIDVAKNAAMSDANGKIDALANRVKAIEDDYLKQADKTELSKAIANEATARATADAEVLENAQKYTDEKLTWKAWA